MAKKKTPPQENIEFFYFWKDHCAPCKAARPLVERIATEHQLTVTYLDVRSPEGEQYIGPFNLLAVPTLVVAKGGKPVASLTGGDLQGFEKLTKKLLKFAEDS